MGTKKPKRMRRLKKLAKVNPADVAHVRRMLPTAKIRISDFVPGSALSATAGLPANGHGQFADWFDWRPCCRARSLSRGDKPQHAVETLDNVVGRSASPLVRELMRARAALPIARRFARSPRRR